MGHLLLLSHHPHWRTEQRFVEEFEQYLLQLQPRLRAVPVQAPARVARHAYRHSRRGREWLRASPIDLVCAAMPSQGSHWSLGSSEAAVQLVLKFNEFLVVTRRLSPRDAAFADGWTRAAQVPVLKDVLRRAIADEDGHSARPPRGHGRSRRPRP